MTWIASLNPVSGIKPGLLKLVALVPIKCEGPESSALTILLSVRKGSPMCFSRLPAVYLAVCLAASLGIPAQTLSAQAHGSLAQQRLCADQANRFFHHLVAPNSPRRTIDPTLASYVDHYDASAHTCYVAIVQNTPSGKNLLYSTGVFDAFEGTRFASYIQSSENIRAGMEVQSPLACSVHPRGQRTIFCKSEGEFNKLLEKYFGLVVQ